MRMSRQCSSISDALLDVIRILVIALVICIVTDYASADQVQTSKSLPNSIILAEDKRLDSLLTLTERNAQLDELLPRLSTKILRLEADRSCAQQKVQLRLKQRSLRTLMQALADLLPGEWIPLEKEKGYVLRMKQNAILKRNEWWQLFLQERERAYASLRVGILKSMRSERLPLNNEEGTGRDSSITD